MPNDKSQQEPPSPPRCAIYARYSSDMQRQSSIEDQIRECKDAADRRGWIVLDEFIRSDEDKTGKTLIGRQGLAELKDLAKQKPKPFDYILIDDTSRFGRNLPDVLKLHDVLRFNQVFLYFTSDDLDSRDPHFRKLYVALAQGDEDFSSKLGDKVMRGQRGRFLNGYVPGGRCYGYRHIAVEDPTRRGEYGRPAVIGVRREIVPEQAVVLVRIFEAYANGMSFVAIAKMLNAEGILSPEAPRTRRNRSWSPTAIDTMLKNEMYIGHFQWNRTHAEQDPETGQRKLQQNPPSEWDHLEMPELRIIPEELWQRVQDRRRKLSDKREAKRLGGMNRTASSREFLFSGLLRCGICGANMTITRSDRHSYYGCSHARERGICLNRLTMQQERLENELIRALANNLADETLRDELVQSFKAELKSTLEVEAKRSRELDSKRSELTAARANFAKQIGNLVNAIKEVGTSPSLSAELRAVETQIADLDRELASKTVPVTPTYSDAEIGEFLTRHSQHFVQVLTGDRISLKQELRKHISELILTPELTEQGAFYEVSGDIRLFAAEPNGVQTNTLECIGLHSIRMPLQLRVEASKVYASKAQIIPLRSITDRDNRKEQKINVARSTSETRVGENSAA